MQRDSRASMKSVCVARVCASWSSAKSSDVAAPAVPKAAGRLFELRLPRPGKVNAKIEANNDDDRGSADVEGGLKAVSLFLDARRGCIHQNLSFADDKSKTAPLLPNTQVGLAAAALAFDMRGRRPKASRPLAFVLLSGASVAGDAAFVQAEFHKAVGQIQQKQAKIQQKEAELVTLGDASNDVEELSLTSEDGEKIPYMVGEIFVKETPDDVLSLLDNKKTDIKGEIKVLEEQATSIKGVMTDLKTHLYAKFGDAINLEADD